MTSVRTCPDPDANRLDSACAAFDGLTPLEAIPLLVSVSCTFLSQLTPMARMQCLHALFTNIAAHAHALDMADADALDAPAPVHVN